MRCCVGASALSGDCFMPSKPLKPCRHPRCPNLTSGRYCSEHTKEYQRPSANERGYNNRWQKRSKLFLKSHPLCEGCLKKNKLTPSVVVDHIVPHHGNPVLMWSESNWQPLCKRCHDTKTGRHDRIVPYTY